MKYDLSGRDLYAKRVAIVLLLIWINILKKL